MGRLIWWGLCIAVVAAIGVVIFRPAAFFGVSGKALANSLGAKVDQSEASCQGDGTGSWRCALQGEDMEGVEYALTTHDYGCWSGTLVAEPRSISQPPARAISGCIGLTDEFGV